MADYKDIYKTPLMSAKSLGKAVIRSTISLVYPETIQGSDGKNQDRLVIEIEDGEQRIALNKGNAVQLAKIFGRDYNEWQGRLVIVKTKKTQYMGKPVDGLDVQPVKK